MIADVLPTMCCMGRVTVLCYTGRLFDELRLQFSNSSEGWGLDFFTCTATDPYELYSPGIRMHSLLHVKLSRMNIDAPSFWV